MNINNITETTLSEHQFWLQIMGDHSRFIFFSLVPTETEYLVAAQEFILIFDQLLEQSHKQLSESELHELNRKAYEATYRLREFKLELLSMSLVSDLKAHLSSSFINGMLNELEEYLFILNSLMQGYNPLLNPLHYHMLWLSDAAQHAATLSSKLDPSEKNLINESSLYNIKFQDLYLKSLELNGYLRTQLSDFPALERFNQQAAQAITSFSDYLENLRDQRMDNIILGTLMPLMADHMAREECYYLWKMSQTTNNVNRPECAPARPRLEA